MIDSQHFDIAAPVVALTASAIVGEIFHIAGWELIWAFIGAFLGLMYEDATPPAQTVKATLWQFTKTVGLLIAVTVATAAILPIIFGATPSMAKNSIAFLSGGVIMLLSGEVKDFKKVAVGSLKDWIKRWLGGFSK